MKNTIETVYYDSLLGFLKLQISDKGLRHLQFVDEETHDKTNLQEMGYCYI